MKMNIRTKMIGGFLVVLALLLVVAIIGYNGLNNMAAATDHIVHEALPEVEEVKDLEFQLALQAELYFEYALTLDPEVLDEARLHTDIILEEAAQLEEQLHGEAELLDILLMFEDEYDEFLLEAELFASLYEVGDTHAGLEALHIMVAEEKQMEEELAELAHLIELDVEESFVAAERAHSTANTLIVVATIIAAIAALVVAFLLSRSISNGVQKVAGALRQVALGDVTTEVNIKSSDEIGDMARSYRDMQEYLEEVSQSLTRVGEGDLTVEAKPRSENDALGNALSNMIASMRRLIGQLGNTANGMTDAGSQLSSAAEQAGKATQGIASSSQEVARGADEQSRSVEQTTSSMSQLTSAIDQIARGGQEQAESVGQASSIVNQVSTAINEVAGNAQSAAEGSREASEAANNGAEMVKQTVDGMGRIRGAVEIASTQISDLGTQSDEIGKIVAVIDDIAAQTNLLALNAAIEAARAGEQGRGFAVVADEVRGLAERVTDATKEIANLIDNIQKGVAESIKAVEEGTREVGDGVQLAEQAGEAINNILEGIQRVGGQIEQISASAEQVSASSDEMVKNIDNVNSIAEQNSASTEEMAANSTEVSKAIEAIASITEQNTASTQQVSASAQEMSAQVEEVVASSQSLNQMADELQTAVAAFRLDDSGNRNGNQNNNGDDEAKEKKS